MEPSMSRLPLPTWFWLSGLLIACAVPFGVMPGCGMGPAKVEVEPQARRQSPQAPPPPANDAGDVNAQADTVAEHTKEMQAAIDRRAAGRGAGSVASKLPPFALGPGADSQLSNVSWEPPVKSFDLSLGPPQESTSPERTWQKLLEQGMTQGNGDPPVINRPLDVSQEPVAPATQPAVTTTQSQQASPLILGPPTPATPDAKVPAATTDDLSTRLESAVKQSPRSLAAQVDLQLYQFLAGKTVPQMDTIAPLAAEDREILSVLIDSLANFRSTLRADENAMLGKKIRPLIDLSDRLRGSADLRVPKVVLCSRVDSFGRYEAMPDDRFPTGRRHEVIIYCDVENVLSRSNERQMWQSSLAQEAALYDDVGRKWWEDSRQATTDQSHNRRRDFYVARRTWLPANLPPGNYYLKVTVVDQLAQRAAQSTLPIRVVDK
jgi:hypothetical protein